VRFVAPGTIAHFDLHRSQTYMSLVGEPSHEPLVVVSRLPRVVVPLTTGRTVLTGPFPPAGG
jgi:hypothetical protein